MHTNEHVQLWEDQTKPGPAPGIFDELDWLADRKRTLNRQLIEMVERLSDD